MQKVFIFIIAAFIAYGCASSKNIADVAIGTWDHIVKDTPYGDVEGNFVIVKEADAYIGTLNSDQGSLPIEELKIEEGKLSGVFYMEGMEIQMKGTFEGTNYTGVVSVDYNEFPMTATKRE